MGTCFVLKPNLCQVNTMGNLDIEMTIFNLEEKKPPILDYKSKPKQVERSQQNASSICN